MTNNIYKKYEKDIEENIYQEFELSRKKNIEQIKQKCEENDEIYHNEDGSIKYLV